MRRSLNGGFKVVSSIFQESIQDRQDSIRRISGMGLTIIDGTTRQSSRKVS